MKLAIIDYGSGNLRSAQKAFERAAYEAGLAATIELTDKPEIVAEADRVVLPGVGAFSDCMRGLTALPGMIEALNDVVHKKGQPFLGICVGMQLMATRGLEHGTQQGLNWIEGDVVAIEPSDPALKVPHMGWNELVFDGGGTVHPLLRNLGADHAYFVHSYHFVPTNPDDVIAHVDYGQQLTAAVARDNMLGTQFHPEKSQTLGLALIANFLKWMP